jgi:hypothetical protein
LQNLFSFRFSENIWRILPDAGPESTLWAIELRDVEDKKVSYAVVDVAAKRMLWHRDVIGGDWWTSLTAFANGNLYFHGYRYPELPEPTDLFAISAETGALLWELPNHLLVRVIDHECIEVAAKTGEQFQHSCRNAANGNLMQIPPREGETGVSIILHEPVRYREGNVYFPKLSEFIQRSVDGHIAVEIDYLEKRPYIIFSYYIYEQDKTVQYLLIVTDQKQLVLHEKLSEGRDGIGRSTMMLKASTLVYLKNNNEFSSLTLS